MHSSAIAECSSQLMQATFEVTAGTLLTAVHRLGKDGGEGQWGESAKGTQGFFIYSDARGRSQWALEQGMDAHCTSDERAVGSA